MVVVASRNGISIGSNEPRNDLRLFKSVLVIANTTRRRDEEEITRIIAIGLDAKVPGWSRLRFLKDGTVWNDWNHPGSVKLERFELQSRSITCQRNSEPGNEEGESVSTHA
jgi:hypothetical protein